MTLIQWGMTFSKTEEDQFFQDWWDFCKMSNTGAHICGWPVFVTWPNNKRELFWETLEGGYVRGI